MDTNQSQNYLFAALVSLNFRLFHEGAERIEGSCKDNIDMIKEGGFACVTEDLSAKSIYSSDFTKTGKCNFYVTEPVKTFNYGMTFPVSCSLEFFTTSKSESHSRRGARTSKNSTSTSAS